MRPLQQLALLTTPRRRRRRRKGLVSAIGLCMYNLSTRPLVSGCYLCLQSHLVDCIASFPALRAGPGLGARLLIAWHCCHLARLSSHSTSMNNLSLFINRAPTERATMLNACTNDWSQALSSPPLRRKLAASLLLIQVLTQQVLAYKGRGKGKEGGERGRGEGER